MRKRAMGRARSGYDRVNASRRSTGGCTSNAHREPVSPRQLATDGAVGDPEARLDALLEEEDFVPVGEAPMRFIFLPLRSCARSANLE